MSGRASSSDRQEDGDRSDGRYPQPRRVSSAKSALLTLLGELVLPCGGATWTGTMVDGLDHLGFSERNARQALARVRDDGLTEPERRGRKTRWHLTAKGRQLLELGAERIYRFGQRAETWDGRWLVVHCSVPETMRRERHQLRTRLSFEGFGFLSPTLAVSPNCRLESTAEQVLAELDLTELAVVFTARTGQLSPDAVILERAWDLTGLQNDYRSFVSRVEGMDPADARARFVALVRLVHEWRRFPFDDPEFPHELLPDDWIGHQARQRFEDCRSRWGPDAATYYQELEASHDT
jgi:phenylacetic acid degradation operon negative regulatory protein